MPSLWSHLTSACLCAQILTPPSSFLPVVCLEHSAHLPFQVSAKMSLSQPDLGTLSKTASVYPTTLFISFKSLSLPEITQVLSMWLLIYHLSPPLGLGSAEMQELAVLFTPLTHPCLTVASTEQAFSRYIVTFHFFSHKPRGQHYKPVRVSIGDLLFSHCFLPPLLRKVCNERASGREAVGRRVMGSDFLRVNLIVALSWNGTHILPLFPSQLCQQDRGDSLWGNYLHKLHVAEDVD